MPRALVRRPAAPGEVEWDPSRGTIDAAALTGVDAVVHLAGESIAGSRWTAAMKARIHDSRVRGTRLLGEAQALYQTAATKEGREQELAEARKRLNRAMELLEPLPPDDTVKKLRRDLSQLLSDIVRVSPF